MTAEPTGHVMWSPDPIRQRLANHNVDDEPTELVLKAPFAIKLPIRDITP
jgi:hypothetical protein